MEMTPLEIEQKLLELPSKIWAHNKKVVQAHEELLLAEKELEDEHANAYLKLKATDSKMTIADLTAKADLECDAQRLAIIVARAKYESSKNDAECADKMLGALQSVIKLRVSEMKGLN